MTERLCPHCGDPHAESKYQRKKNGRPVGWCRDCRTSLEKSRRLDQGIVPKEFSYLNADGNKLCLRCDVFKSLDEFSPSSKGIGGVSSHCKKCQALSQRKVDPIKVRAVTAKYRQTNRAIYLANHRITQFKRKTGLKALSDGTLTKDVLISLYSQTNCYYCLFLIPQDQRTLDHKIPLSRGGTHGITNVVMACLSCNASKSSKTEAEFWEFRKTI